MSSSSSLGGGFSFDTPQAVLEVLASVRQSDIPVKDKNELRDLVLTYTNGGKDPSLKIQIEQKLQSFHIAPVTAPAALVVPALQHDFGSSRNVPAFDAAVAAYNAPTPTPTPAPASTSKPVPTAAPTSVPQPEAAPAPQAASVPAPASVPSAQPTSGVSVETPATATDATAVLNRVREIKALVNEKVGNPVNLVDIDNAVGREYMSSLLDAMKKLSAGSVGAAEMQRLEAAYAAVEKVLENKPQPTPASAQQAAPEPSPTPAPAPMAEQAPTFVPPPAPAVKPLTEMAQSPAPARAVPISTPALEPTPEPEPESTPVSEKAVPKGYESANQVPLADDRWAAAASSIAPTPVKPISETAKPLKTVEDLTETKKPEPVTNDPLMALEVSQGLDQLLSDWVLFKKSGLFGTGPKGVEHPLYQKIKNLQIPLLLAGRFEGATQEIKQSITDYMNGWRYEQGIVYEQGETFDHYLRRVIRHILDLQK